MRSKSERIIEFKENKFSVLWHKKTNTVFIGALDDLIDKTVELLANGNPEDVELLEIQLTEKEIKATGVPWSKVVKRIAELMKKTG